jgi:hypothetical protein
VSRFFSHRQQLPVFFGQLRDYSDASFSILHLGSWLLNETFEMRRILILSIFCINLIILVNDCLLYAFDLI